jgi:diaminopimelate decarboxylase
MCTVALSELYHEIAEQVGTPVYLYDTAVLLHQASQYPTTDTSPASCNKLA